MPFHHNLHSQSLDNIKHEPKPKREIYARIHETMDLSDMYEALDPQVTQLVKQSRIKLISMNAIKSQNLVNKTHSKLIAYMRSQPERKTYFSTPPHSQRSPKKIFNFYKRKDNVKQNRTQQIFDFSKLQKIVQNYQRNSNNKTNQNRRFHGALAEKVLKLAYENHRGSSLSKPTSQRTSVKINLEPSKNTENYMSWKSEKLKRKMKNLFN